MASTGSQAAAMSLHQHSLERVGMVAVPGGDIHFRLYQPHQPEKAARTPLVVTHGGPGASSIGLYDALHELADERPVVFYDQLGSYCSPCELTPGQMTLQRFAEEPLALMNALGLSQAAVMGHSWGGAVMAQFCLDHPLRVSHLVLSSPLLSTQRWIQDCKKLIANLVRDGVPSNQIEDEFNKHHFSIALKSSALLARDAERFNTHLYEVMWGPSEFRQTGLLASLDLFPRLMEIKACTLLLCGDHDTATPLTMHDAQQCIGKNAEVVVVPDSAHKTYIDNNEGFLDAVNLFLAGI